MPKLPQLNPGERVIMAGRTGAGKTSLACWLLSRSRQKWVILNPKHTAGYNNLPDSITIRDVTTKNVEKAIDKYKYIILNFDGSQTNRDFMDGVVKWIHDNYSNIGVCADELYSMHKRGEAGDGLIGYLTRGRELKQSFFGLCQRPAWVSRFVFTEADHMSSLDLTTKDDQKRFFEFSGKDEFMGRLPPFYWRWYNVKADTMQLWKPVPLT